MYFRGFPLFLLLAIFSGWLFFAGLGNRDLYSSHEARAAQNAQMILDEDGWVLPRLFDGQIELQKPPLYYWLVAMIAWVRGGVVDAWAVRLPAALAGWLCVGFLYLLGCKLRRPLAGFLAGTILASFVHFTWLARVGRIDMPLTLCVTVALGSFFLGNCRRGEGIRYWPWFLLGYLALAAGLLFKGPIAVVLVAGVIVAMKIGEWLLPVGNFQKTQSLFGAPARQEPRPPAIRPVSTLWWGLPLVAAIAAPWFIWANIQTENRLWEVFFWYHNVERGFGSDVLHAHPWWFYGPRLFIDLAPWSLLLPWALWHALKKNGIVRNDSEARATLVWLFAIFGFLSLMRFKRADYLLPAFPGAALFLGCVLERYWQIIPVQRRKMLASLFVLTLGSCLAGWTGYQRIQAETADAQDWTYPKLAQEIRRLTKGQVIFFRAEAHDLAFHVGRPVNTILEWENLEVWAKQPRPIYFVMPIDCADEWTKHLPAGRLVEILRIPGDKARSERPLALMRSEPYNERGTK